MGVFGIEGYGLFETAKGGLDLLLPLVEGADLKIKAVNLSVFIPPELANEYLSQNTSQEDAKAVMERLGPFVLKQMRNELEILGMRALGYIRRGNDRVEYLRYPTVQELISALKKMEKTNSGRYVPKAIRIALENMLTAEEENLNRGLSVHSRDEKAIPEILPGFAGLPNVSDYAEARSEEHTSELQSH